MLPNAKLGLSSSAAIISAGCVRMMRRLFAGGIILLSLGRGEQGFSLIILRSRLLPPSHKTSISQANMSHHSIGVAYHDGEGVGSDRGKTNHYFELAAMGGHLLAR